jgi:uncharacterized protein YjbI with pentapeptide repeats
MRRGDTPLIILGADLRGADFLRANLTGADLTTQPLVHSVGDAAPDHQPDSSVQHDIDCRVAGDPKKVPDPANLTSAKKLTQEQLDRACGTEAKLPPNLNLKPCPPPQPAASLLNQSRTP